ncbi:hypothetical protein VNO78_18691 [Psophocarpus tetragonolobus]|uniref:Uncharacterized protein n=1 Tax=Psophocarpus tetragonolobus TaxID=3891 RepID=A0AAN9XM25_PSOTE
MLLNCTPQVNAYPFIWTKQMPNGYARCFRISNSYTIIKIASEVASTEQQITPNQTERPQRQVDQTQETQGQQEAGQETQPEEGAKGRCMKPTQTINTHKDDGGDGVEAKDGGNAWEVVDAEAHEVL